MLLGTTTKVTAGALLEALRPHHWVKNVVVVAAPVFALAIGPVSLLRVGGTFVAFSMMASGFYLVNDIQDVEADRNHPVKQHRPIASGRLPISLAGWTAAVLILGALGISLVITPLLGATIGGYAFLQAGYNAGLKHQPILDIMTVASGFMLRAVGGAAAVHVPVSGWFILCVGLLAFFLGIEKRKNELRALGDQKATRAVLKQYSLSWLRRMESAVTASALMAYALWTLEGAQTKWMLVTLPFVVYAIFRYQYLSEQGRAETPERVLIADGPMLATVLLWGATALMILGIHEMELVNELAQFFG